MLVSIEKAPFLKARLMKRINNLFEKVVTKDNLMLAYQKARKGKSGQYGVKIFERNVESNIDTLYNELILGIYKTSEYSVFKIYDPKEREIFRLPFRDRVVHHAIMNILEPIWTTVFIHNTYSCIKGRGIHAVLKDLKQDLKDIENTTYCLKLDIKKFYPTIDHEILKAIIRKKIKDKRLLYLLDEIIDSAPGIPIGNYLSQFFANLYLSYFDHWIKETKQVKYYYRYADDMVILASNKQYLHGLLVDIDNYIMNKLKLQIKGNYQVFPVDSRGIDFVGYVFYHTHILMRKTIKKQFCRKAAKLNKKDLEPKEYLIAIASHLGWAKHCNSNNLLKTILNMNKFADFGIKTQENSHIFQVPKISIEDVLNTEIEILDYEPDVKTKFGEGRYILKIRHDGIEQKFFTNAAPIKDALDKIDKQNFPFTATIKPQKFGTGLGKTFYFT